mmetsp:Transcript_9018/g.18779  ORF Transcript_9018/g.18779 Transcript_9018/m.18779 type:complete len:200 (-) Transcript_9018:681-1280(-)
MPRFSIHSFCFNFSRMDVNVLLPGIVFPLYSSDSNSLYWVKIIPQKCIILVSNSSSSSIQCSNNSNCSSSNPPPESLISNKGGKTRDSKSLFNCLVYLLASLYSSLIFRHLNFTSSETPISIIANLDAGRPSAADAIPTSTRVNNGATIFRRDLSERCLLFIRHVDFNRPVSVMWSILFACSWPCFLFLFLSSNSLTVL